MSITDQSVIEWAEHVPVTVARHNWSERSLRGAAEGNAVLQRFAYLDRCQVRGEQVDADSYHEDVRDADRALVNYLRHDCSNYDSLLAQLETWELTFDEDCFDEDGELIDDEGYFTEVLAFNDEKETAYATIRRRVHAALAEAYPQFAELIEVHSTTDTL